MQNPLSHLDIDTRPIENAFEVVTETFSDVTESIGEHISDDVIPLAKAGAEHTRQFVRTRTRVSLAAVAGVAALIGLLVLVRRRRRDDAEMTVDPAAVATAQPRSVA